MSQPDGVKIAWDKHASHFKLKTYHDQLRILSQSFNTKSHPVVRQLRAEVPWHVVVLIAVKLPLEVFERRSDFVRHERKETTNERPHDEVVENLRLGRGCNDRNLMNQLKILHLDRRVIIDSISRKHVLNRRVDRQRVRSRFDIVKSKDFGDGAFLSRCFHRGHNATLETEEIVNEALGFGVGAGLQAVVHVANEFFVSDDDLRRNKSERRKSIEVLAT